MNNTEFVDTVKNGLSILGLPLNFHPSRSTIIGLRCLFGWKAHRVVLSHRRQVKRYENNVNSLESD